MPTIHHPPLKQGWAALLLAGMLLAAAGCMAPGRDSASAGSDELSPAASPVQPAPDTAPPPLQAPPMSDPLPPLPVPDREPPTPPATLPAGGPVQIDTTCTRDADCTIKDVGNCCGYYPACVNVDSPTDPAAVKAQCAREGTMSVCGFPEISSCRCEAGQCQPGTAAVGR